MVVGTLIGGVQAVGTFIKERSTCRGRSVWQNGHVKRVNPSVRSRSSRSAEQWKLDNDRLLGQTQR